MKIETWRNGRHLIRGKRSSSCCERGKRGRRKSLCGERDSLIVNLFLVLIVDDLVKDEGSWIVDLEGLDAVL